VIDDTAIPKQGMSLAPVRNCAHSSDGLGSAPDTR
jgi:hypothetical protein